jgi:hypothetical protein
MRMSFKIGRLLARSLTLLAATGCVGRGDDTHRFRIVEEGGVAVHLTTGGPRFTGELFTYEKILELQEGPTEESLFIRPFQFLGDEAGRFYVNDIGYPKILVFGPDGCYLNSIGRRGQGPGEFIGGRIQSVDGGTVTFFEALGNRRTQRFSWDGTFIDTIRIPSGLPLLGAVGAYRLDGGGQLILTATSNPANLGETRKVGAIVCDAEGDTTAHVETPYVRAAQRMEIRIQSTTATIAGPITYGPYPESIFHPTQGIVLVTGTEPELLIYNLEGEHVRTVRIELPAEPVTEADRETARRLYRQLVDETEEALKEMARSQMESLVFAEQKAPWGGVEIDDDGYFWLQVPVPFVGRDMQATLAYRVLSPRGEYLGITQRPAGAFHGISHGRLLILEEDPESGAMVPTVYAIRPAVRGLRYP